MQSISLDPKSIFGARVAGDKPRTWYAKHEEINEAYIELWEGGRPESHGQVK